MNRRRRNRKDTVKKNPAEEEKSKGGVTGSKARRQWKNWNRTKRKGGIYGDRRIGA